MEPAPFLSSFQYHCGYIPTDTNVPAPVSHCLNIGLNFCGPYFWQISSSVHAGPKFGDYVISAVAYMSLSKFRENFLVPRKELGIWLNKADNGNKALRYLSAHLNDSANCADFVSFTGEKEPFGNFAIGSLINFIGVKRINRCNALSHGAASIFGQPKDINTVSLFVKLRPRNFVSIKYETIGGQATGDDPISNENAVIAENSYFTKSSR
jgi:hypothetical protein